MEKLYGNHIRRIITAIIVLACVCGFGLFAYALIAPHQVKDINPGADGSWPDNMTDVAGTLLFTANGNQMWKSDGTEAGTVMVKDLNSAAGDVYNDINVDTNVVANGNLFFIMYNYTSSMEYLWKSDGTEAGTLLVKHIDMGFDNIPVDVWTADPLAVSNGIVYFNASDGVNGYELWKSDGTGAGTVMVKDFAGSLWPDNLTDVDGTLFFTAYDSTIGRELWKSDGTAGGTVLVKDIWPGPGYNSSDPKALVNSGGKLFFVAEDGLNYAGGIWKSDGTLAGTIKLADIPVYKNWYPGELVDVGGTLFFIMPELSTVSQLWKSDGTPAGTVPVKDTWPGTSSPDPFGLTDVGGTLYFIVNDGTNGHELWKSDGSEAGTVKVKDFPLVGVNQWFGEMVDCDGMLYFIWTYLTDPPSSIVVELWKSNGTENGTVLVNDLGGGGSLTAVGDTLYFAADDGASGLELWALTNINTGDPELPHYEWDAWLSGGDCTVCHESVSTFLSAGFKEDPGLCRSCHNAAGPAHGRDLVGAREHSIMVNVTSGGCSMPTYGSYTSGEYDNRMFANLAAGDKVVCVTCHNTMRKTEDVGRTWEYTTTSDDRTYSLQYGGWGPDIYKTPRVYRDSVLWSGPALAKDRMDYLVDPSEYTYNEYSGTVTFAQAQNPTDYVYVTLEYPYLRVSNASNTMCSDCHVEQTHQGANCLTCHAPHNSDNEAGIRGSVRMTNTSTATVVFTNRTGTNSFADGDGTYDGICEVCHTQTLYHKNDGSGAAHNAGTDCTSCHGHAGGFPRQ